MPVNSESVEICAGVTDHEINRLNHHSNTAVTC